MTLPNPEKSGVPVIEITRPASVRVVSVAKCSSGSSIQDSSRLSNGVSTSRAMLLNR